MSRLQWLALTLVLPGLQSCAAGWQSAARAEETPVALCHPNGAAALTPIPLVQGAAAGSDWVGKTLTVSGVVVGDFQGATELNGFFLQDPMGDADVSTSDGLFVYAPGAVEVSIGDRVQVRGIVKEYYGLTELTTVSQVSRCGREALPEPVLLDGLPAHSDEWERLEGMRVRLTQPLVVTDNVLLGRFGTVALGQRLPLPGEKSASSGSDRLWLDDGSWRRFPRPTPYLVGLGAAATLRRGARVVGFEGIWSYGFGDYRLHPTAELTFADAGSRPLPPVRSGAVRVASFNLHNYFVTLEKRGARTAIERDRQARKLAATIAALDADAVALVEVENRPAVVEALLQALRALPEGQGYQAVESGDAGKDVIAVRMIYRPLRLQLCSAAQRLRSETIDRWPLAQCFAAGRRRFVLAAAHLKSKANCPPQASDVNADRGQGCWNVQRTRQSGVLAEWMGRLKQEMETHQVLLMGDLNADSNEDPIAVLRRAGLRDVLGARLAVEQRYSYVFMGTPALLDHAFATPGLAAVVRGSAVWHINADEPECLDYVVQQKTDDRYAPTPFRSSDHDPVIVDLYAR